MLFSGKFTNQLLLTPPYVKNTGPHCPIELSQTQYCKLEGSLKAGKYIVEEDHYAGSMHEINKKSMRLFS